jgi:hypothetical protein
VATSRPWTDPITARSAAGVPLRAAECRLWAAEAALTHRDRDAAAELLRSAATDAARMGAAPLLARPARSRARRDLLRKQRSGRFRP